MPKSRTFTPFQMQLRDHYYLTPYRFDTQRYFSARELDLYISYRLSNYQLSSIKYGIYLHGLPYIEKIHKQTKVVIFFIEINDHISGIIKGLACQQSLFIEEIHINNIKHGLMLLNILKNYLKTNQIDHASTDILTSNNPNLNLFQLSGFIETQSMNGNFIYKITSQQIQRIQQTNLSQKTREFLDHRIANDFYENIISRYESPPNNNQSHYRNVEQFGLFMRDRRDNIVAGLIGEIVTNRNQKSLNLDRLWIAEAYRGNHFSPLFVRLAEQHAANRGCRSSSLHTMEYYAPWLYPKLGYQMFFKQKIGSYKGYYYQKSISATPHP